MVTLLFFFANAYSCFLNYALAALCSRLGFGDCVGFNFAIYCCLGLTTVVLGSNLVHTKYVVTADGPSKYDFVCWKRGK